MSNRSAAPAGASEPESVHRATTSTRQPFESLVRQARHDLRNPLSDILGFSEILQEEASERGHSQLIEGLREIHQAASIIFDQVNHCLNLQSIQADPGALAALPGTIDSYSEKIATTAEGLSQQCAQLASDSLGDDLSRIAGAARRMKEIAPVLLAPLSENRTQTATQPENLVQPAFRENRTAELPRSTTLPSEVETGVAAPLTAAAHANEAASSSGSLLVVDDNEANRALLCRHLRRQGYTVALAENGRKALEQLRAHPFDLVLLDILMPELDGHQVLEQMKADERLRHLPVIMISALDDLASLVRCIEKGAEDYLTKPFDPVLLRARIGSCLEKKRLHDREQRAYQALAESQKHLAAELAEAASYIKSLLPPPLTGELRTELRFLPSSQLGGDAFGYHWLDPDHFAIYLLDVCGHGVGAALLSISAINVLRFQTLSATDFRDPGAVLSGLNEAFQMDRHHNMYFTLWYGVFQKSRRRLSYASGGHPPAILLTGPARESAVVEKLGTNGMIIGVTRGAAFVSKEIDLQPFSQLYVFSDGAYEITKPDGSMLTFSEFAAHLADRTRWDHSNADTTLQFLEKIHGSNVYEDDLSLLELTFH